MNVSAAGNAWNPRVGLAYQMTPKTVIRAGYGRSFDLGVFGSTFGHVVTQNIPVLANQSLSGTAGPTSYAFNLSDPTNTTVPGIGKPVNATSPLANYTPPATNSNGQIPITEILPGTGGASIGSSVSVKARPFTERLPTLDAWNAAVQHSLSPTISVEVSYVGNKGTHTLSDGDGNNTNPNEAAISLPGSFTQNGVALHYDPTVKTGVSANGGTANTTLLQRYTNGTLPACAGGPCGWTQGISYYGDDQDTHYNALQTKFTKTFSQGLSINLNYAYQRGYRHRKQLLYLGQAGRYRSRSSHPPQCVYVLRLVEPAVRPKSDVRRQRQLVGEWDDRWLGVQPDLRLAEWTALLPQLFRLAAPQYRVTHLASRTEM